MVGARRFELRTSCAQGRRATVDKCILYNRLSEKQGLSSTRRCVWLWLDVAGCSQGPYKSRYSNAGHERPSNLRDIPVPTKRPRGFLNLCARGRDCYTPRPEAHHTTISYAPVGHSSEGQIAMASD